MSKYFVCYDNAYILVYKEKLLKIYSINKVQKSKFSLVL